jgi:hypothetical protein
MLRHLFGGMIEDSVIATPTHAIRIKHPRAAPTGIDWSGLDREIQLRNPWFESGALQRRVMQTSITLTISRPLPSLGWRRCIFQTKAGMTTVF